jgi:peroxiredoxin (alkyl hydroperoxide reductase subunit C)
MSELPLIQVGQQVPDFTLTTYEPKTKGFGKFNLAEAKKNGKWTLLFFYPAGLHVRLSHRVRCSVQSRQDRFAKMGCEIVTR